MHSTPADLSLGGEALAIVFGDGAGLGKCLRDSPGIAGWIFGPLRRRRRGVDAYYAITANTKLAQLFADLAGLLYLVKKTCPLLVGTHRRATAGGGPDRGNERAHHQVAPGNAVCKAFQLIAGRIDTGVRQRQE